MNEIEKLNLRFGEYGVTMFHATGPNGEDITLNNITEEQAAEINRVDSWLSDPVNNLIARVEGLIFLKQDTVMCLEDGWTFNSETKDFEKRILSKEEESIIRNNKECISLLQECVNMIEDLNGRLVQR